MKQMKQLKRVRLGVRAALVLGVAVSVVANVLHAKNNVISQAIAAWAPLALLITIELISRIPIDRRALAVARVVATSVIAGIAAWVSYWHMAGVAAKYGETGAAPYLIPISVDGLIVVASICLVELGGRIRALESAPTPVTVSTPVDTPGSELALWEEISSEPVPDPWDYAEPIGPEPEQVDSLSTPKAPVRKPQPSSRERVEKAHKRTPDATNEELAKRLKLSTKTVQRYRPERPAEEPEQVDKPINGHQPELVGVTS